ncbi:MAG: hypothetical protein VKI63_05805 [Cyanobium sp.]|nr:hypothetical protein [Cyanobium sp.]
MAVAVAVAVTVKVTVAVAVERIQATRLEATALCLATELRSEPSGGSEWLAAMDP